jgi:hypothetical protein
MKRLSKPQLFRENNLYIKMIKDLIPQIDEKSDLTICSVCYVNLKPRTVTFILGCNHFFCNSCIKQHINCQIKDFKGNIKCLVKNCSNIISHYQLHKFITMKQFNNYLNMLLHKMVESSDDMIFCPKNTCSMICVKGECSNKVNCLYCFNQFCFTCRQTFKTKHKFEQEHLLRNIPQDIIDFYKSEGKLVKICPNSKCSMLIEKKNGCNAITCRLCSTQFCWDCLATKDDIDRQGSAHRTNCGTRTWFENEENEEDEEEESETTEEEDEDEDEEEN